MPLKFPFAKRAPKNGVYINIMSNIVKSICPIPPGFLIAKIEATI